MTIEPNDRLEAVWDELKRSQAEERERSLPNHARRYS